MSAHTMKLLVALSREKKRTQEEARIRAKSQHSRKNLLRRGKTLHNVKATTTEERVARRITMIAGDKSPSVQATDSPDNDSNNNNNDSNHHNNNNNKDGYRGSTTDQLPSSPPAGPRHIRSYSNPKNTIDHMSTFDLEDMNTFANINAKNDKRRNSIENDIPDEEDIESNYSENENENENENEKENAIITIDVPVEDDDDENNGGYDVGTVANIDENFQIHVNDGNDDNDVANNENTNTESNGHNHNNTGDNQFGGLMPPSIQTPQTPSGIEFNNTIRFAIYGNGNDEYDAQNTDNTANNTNQNTAEAVNGNHNTQLSNSNNNESNTNTDNIKHIASQSHTSVDFDHINNTTANDNDNNNNSNNNGNRVKLNTMDSEENASHTNDSPSSHGRTNNINDNNNNTNSSLWSLLCCCCGHNGNNSGNNNINNNNKKSPKKGEQNYVTRLTTASGVGSHSQDQHAVNGNNNNNNNNGNSGNFAATHRKTSSAEFGTDIASDIEIENVTKAQSNSSDGSAFNEFVKTRMENDIDAGGSGHSSFTIANQTLNPSDIRMWDEPFGNGASGRVYKAMYIPLCQVIAVKVVNRLDSENVKQILGEFRDQSQLLPNCNQLLKIFGWYHDLQQNTVVIALEYMDMGSIYDSCFPKPPNANLLNTTKQEQEKSGHEQITVKKLSYEQIRFIAKESLLGLNALHTCEPPLVHRDIKPQNILATSWGEIKVADFGLLKKVDATTMTLTESKGTQKYFSPERANAGEYGTKSDIWALGITMIEIYNQELISSEKLDWFKLTESGIDIKDHMPSTGVEPEFMDFLSQCLTKDQNLRPTAAQLLEHEFITLNEKKQARIQMAEVFRDQDTKNRLLKKVLTWLQEWILDEDQLNASLFEEGDPAFLRTCVNNLSRITGHSTDFIDTYIAEVYRELVSTNK